MEFVASEFTMEFTMAGNWNTSSGLSFSVNSYVNYSINYIDFNSIVNFAVNSIDVVSLPSLGLPAKPAIAATDVKPTAITGAAVLIRC